MTKVGLMDVLEALNSGLSHGVVAEITVHSQDEDELTRVAYAWLTGGVDLALSGRFPRETVVNGSKVARGGLKSAPAFLDNGNSGEWWGYVSVAPSDTFGVLCNPYSASALPWIMEQLKRRPESLHVQIGRFGEDRESGSPVLHLYVEFDDELEEYVKLSYRLEEDDLLSHARDGDNQYRLLKTLKWACRSFPAVFLHFSYANSGGRTELERCLRGMAGSPVANTPRWAERLRGYSWVMLVPLLIVQRLGGIEALRQSAAFEEIEELPNGAAWIQVTTDYASYRGDCVVSVRDVFRDVLIEGPFRQPNPVPGTPPTHMVIID